MSLSRFITENMDAIVAEWETFAQTMTPAADTMSAPALRDHSRQILKAIALDLDSSQTALAQAEKSKGLALPLSARETAAATHGALRHLSGFDLNQLGAEYRALRASVIRLWTKHPQSGNGPEVFEEMIRFNEAVDQAIAESTSRYAAELALSRDTFMAIVAHDLRSPLNAITMVSYLMEKQAPNDGLRKHAAQIQKSAKEMAGMVHDLLEYTRTQLGKGIPVSPRDCLVMDACRDCVDEVRAAHPERLINLDVPADLMGRIDEARLRQALSNLLNNALQHGSAGTPISLQAKAHESEIVLTVTNFGTPIPPSSLQVIFDPLVQLSLSDSAPTVTNSTNLGLGLFIAREVALGHHGTLEVTSDETAGTVFSLRLPAA
ncbi:MAG: sensor histidine kinase [Pseudomonadota bacterium]